MEQYPLVYVITLLYNGKRWIEEFLRSVLESDYPNIRLLVIDNASKDDGVDCIEKNFPTVEVIKNEINLGTSKANNSGCRHALKNGADYVFLINQDTVVTKNCISELVKLAEKNPSVGMLVPVQYDYHNRNNMSITVKRLLETEDNIVRRADDYVVVKEVMGAGMLISKKFIEKAGLFDPMYFIYFEENDLVRRGYYHGFESAFSLISKIFHWDTLIHQQSQFANDLFKRNQLIMALKEPYRLFASNLFCYYTNLLAEKIKTEGAWKGIRRFFGIARKQICVFFLFPAIIRNRYREKQAGCYINN
ncbi:glycosyltransferase family 2 protein [Candidatus Omnitrophota bacterium]